MLEDNLKAYLLIGESPHDDPCLGADNVKRGFDCFCHLAGPVESDHEICCVCCVSGSSFPSWRDNRSGNMTLRTIASVLPTLFNSEGRCIYLGKQVQVWMWPRSLEEPKLQRFVRT